MAKTEWNKNRCYFCGSSTPPLHIHNYQVIACKSCRHLYKDVPSHIPVEQVKRYHMRTKNQILYKYIYEEYSLDKQIKFDTT